MGIVVAMVVPILHWGNCKAIRKRTRDLADVRETVGSRVPRDRFAVVWRSAPLDNVKRFRGACGKSFLLSLIGFESVKGMRLISGGEESGVFTFAAEDGREKEEAVWSV